VRIRQKNLTGFETLSGIGSLMGFAPTGYGG